MNPWVREFVCEWHPEPPHPLSDLAAEYYERAEAYDRTVCSGPIGRDGILPADSYELGLINRNAHRILKELRLRAAGRGFQSADLSDALRIAGGRKE